MLDNFNLNNVEQENILTENLQNLQDEQEEKEKKYNRVKTTELYGLLCEIKKNNELIYNKLENLSLKGNGINWGELLPVVLALIEKLIPKQQINFADFTKVFAEQCAAMSSIVRENLVSTQKIISEITASNLSNVLQEDEEEEKEEKKDVDLSSLVPLVSKLLEENNKEALLEGLKMFTSGKG